MDLIRHHIFQNSIKNRFELMNLYSFSWWIPIWGQTWPKTIPEVDFDHFSKISKFSKNAENRRAAAPAARPFLIGQV